METETVGQIERERERGTVVHRDRAEINNE